LSRTEKDSELVLGLISTVGTDVDAVIQDIQDQLALFRYEVERISVSQDILSQFEEKRPDWKDEFDRVSYYMDLGNQIRVKTGDNSILMKGVARELHLRRVDEHGCAQPRPRIAYIINH